MTSYTQHRNEMINKELDKLVAEGHSMKEAVDILYDNGKLCVSRETIRLIRYSKTRYIHNER